MKLKTLKQIIWHLSAAILYLHATAAHATLGGNAASVTADEQALSGIDGGTSTQTNYSVQKFSIGTLIVNEYISNSGIVFGIAWAGRRHPNFKVLLGSYYSSYQKGRNILRKKHARGARSVRASQVTLETWGTMMKLQGHAYAPALLPTGVNANAIQ